MRGKRKATYRDEPVCALVHAAGPGVVAVGGFFTCAAGGGAVHIAEGAVGAGRAAFRGGAQSTAGVGLHPPRGAQFTANGANVALVYCFGERERERRTKRIVQKEETPNK